MGMGPISTVVDRYRQQQADQQRQWDQELANAAVQPIPGFTGSVAGGGNIPGLLNNTPYPVGPPQRIPPPIPQYPQFQPVGPYGQQAMQLAGLLGHVNTPQMPTSGYQGLLGRRFLGRIPGEK